MAGSPRHGALDAENQTGKVARTDASKLSVLPFKAHSQY